jgi:hypothetical protein
VTLAATSTSTGTPPDTPTTKSALAALAALALIPEDDTDDGGHDEGSHGKRAAKARGIGDFRDTVTATAKDRAEYKHMTDYKDTTYEDTIYKDTTYSYSDATQLVKDKDSVEDSSVGMSMSPATSCPKPEVPVHSMYDDDEDMDADDEGGLFFPESPPRVGVGDIHVCGVCVHIHMCVYAYHVCLLMYVC